MRGRPNSGRGGSSGCSVNVTPSGFGDRRHAREEFAEVLAQHRGIDAAILLQAVAELRDRQRIGRGARQRAGNVGDEDVDIGLRHPE